MFLRLRKLQDAVRLRIFQFEHWRQQFLRQQLERSQQCNIQQFEHSGQRDCQQLERLGDEPDIQF
jgi:hypothetical protein